MTPISVPYGVAPREPTLLIPLRNKESVMVVTGASFEFDPIVAQWTHLGAGGELPRTLQVRNLFQSPLMASKQEGEDTVITVGTDTVTLLGMQLSSLQTDDFLILA